MADLQIFYNDVEARKNVQEYLVAFIHEEAVRMLFEREDTKGIADAKELVDKAFENLDLMFAPKQKPKDTTPR